MSLRPISIRFMVESENEEVQSEEGEDKEESEEKEEIPKENPEVTAMKEEISNLEGNLNTLRRTYSNLKEAAENYSEKGYLRKCAEMDNTRRRRESFSSDDRVRSRASAVKNFIPVLDKLQELSQKYEEVDFAKPYNALGSNFRNSFTELNVVEFEMKSNEIADPNKVKRISEEYSDEYAKGTVIHQEKSGLELQGNVIKLAECVVSLGSEKEAIAEAEAKAKKIAEEKKNKEEEEEEEETEQNEGDE